MALLTISCNKADLPKEDFRVPLRNLVYKTAYLGCLAAKKNDGRLNQKGIKFCLETSKKLSEEIVK